VRVGNNKPAPGGWPRICHGFRALGGCPASLVAHGFEAQAERLMLTRWITRIWPFDRLGGKGKGSWRPAIDARGT